MDEGSGLRPGRDRRVQSLTGKKAPLKGTSMPLLKLPEIAVLSAHRSTYERSRAWLVLASNSLARSDLEITGRPHNFLSDPAAVLNINDGVSDSIQTFQFEAQ
jgi:hypothetical protein